MYVLTIVFLASHVTLVSMHSTKELCEQLAARALAFSAGSQRVESAKCDFSSAEPDPRTGSMPGDDGGMSPVVASTVVWQPQRAARSLR